MNLNVARRRLEDEWQWLLCARDAIDCEQLSAQSADDRVGELSPIDQHQADVGSETFEREKDFSIRDQVAHDLVAVQEAFVRIDQGTYGRCETCRAPIPDERLDAVPTRSYSVPTGPTALEPVTLGTAVDAGRTTTIRILLSRR